MSSFDEFQHGELVWEIQDATLDDIAEKLADVSEMVKGIPGGDLPTRVKFDGRTATLKVTF